MMRMPLDTLEQADQGCRDLAQDIQQVTRERERRRAIVYGPRQIVKFRFIDLVRIAIVTGLAVGVAYTVVWLLTHWMPW